MCGSRAPLRGKTRLRGDAQSVLARFRLRQLPVAIVRLRKNPLENHTFAALELDARLLRALSTLGHESPTQIQAKAIPLALEGHDVLACAQTGTGKTGGFALPALDIIARKDRRSRNPGVLVLAPTRELAVQIAEAFVEYGQYMPHIGIGLLIGGVAMGPQLGMLRRGIDVLVATPGRLRDHMAQGSIRLNEVEICVFDEADRMLDLGFVKDVRAIAAALPEQRQTMLFSATLPSSVLSLARDFMTDAMRVDAAAQGSTPRRVTQHAYHLHAADKRNALLTVLDDPDMTQTIVFARTKHGADKLARFLETHGHRVAVLHGNKSQRQRQDALNAFKRRAAPLLIATDIAARGIDVQGISHVVNYDMPQVPEDYVHRIGRTGRASASGIALSFISPDDFSMARSIEKLTGQPIEIRTLDGFEACRAPSAPPPRRRRKPRRRFAA